MAPMSQSNERGMLRDVLSAKHAEAIWSLSDPVLFHVTFDSVQLESVMPAVLYMLRRGARRGAGEFKRTFASVSTESPGKVVVTAADVARVLLANARDSDETFKLNIAEPEATAIIANMLSGFCFDNTNSEPGIDKPIQRVYPVHYFSSWFDLPETVAHLRFVPELIVSIICSAPQQNKARRLSGNRSLVHPNMDSSVSRVILNTYGVGLGVVEDEKSTSLGRSSDPFDETLAKELGIDQLLMIRTAQCLPTAPKNQSPTRSTKGNAPRFSFMTPITLRQNEIFERDLRIFLRTYAQQLPKQTLNHSIEALVAVNLISMLGSFATIMSRWQETGSVLLKLDQRPVPFLVDCSGGQDRELRHQAEASFEKFWSQYLSLPISMKLFQIARTYGTNKVRQHFKDQESDSPIEILGFLGDILHGNTAPDVTQHIDYARSDLINAMHESNLGETYLSTLENPHEMPALAFARTIVSMMGKTVVQSKLALFLDNVLQVGDAFGEGFLAKRVVQRRVGGETRKAFTVRSVRLPDGALEALVHRYLRKESGSSHQVRLTVRKFLLTLADHYGLYIDQNPPGNTIPSDILIQNRLYLEERLRALGLLNGINDAENMKTLQGRFQVEVTDNDEDTN